MQAYQRQFHLLLVALLSGIFNTIYSFTSIFPAPLILSRREKTLPPIYATDRNTCYMNRPRHIGFIVDGNGRWAAERGLSRIAGHRAGANTTVNIVKQSFEMWKMEYVTLYLFSTENWKRPYDEVLNIMSLLEEYLLNFRDYLMTNKIRLAVIGQTDRLPEAVRSLIATFGFDGDATNYNATLCLAISYGGRDDIVRACRQVASKVGSGDISVGEITEEMISAETDTGTKGIPDPDLIVRTSGERRLSNFLLWQSAYAEFASVSKYWPDMTREDLDSVIEDFSHRSRRFGSSSAAASRAWSSSLDTVA